MSIDKFNKAVEDAKALIEQTSDRVQEQIGAVEAKIREAEGHVVNLTEQYDSLLLEGRATEATDIRRALTTWQDMAAALERQLGPLREKEESVRRDAKTAAAAAIAKAVLDIGNPAIEKIREEAQKAREAYMTKLNELQSVQHKVAAESSEMKRGVRGDKLKVDTGYDVRCYPRDKLLVGERDLSMPRHDHQY